MPPRSIASALTRCEHAFARSCGHHPELQSERLVVLGVDVASVRGLNYVIEDQIDEDHCRLVAAGELDDGPRGTAFEQLCALMDRYSVNLAAVDRAPEGRFSEAFAEQSPAG